MEPQDLQNYLYRHIPITKAMGVEVRESGYNKVLLFAPLAKNINHRDTVFGGSASTLAILSAWALLYVRLAVGTVAPRVVIQQNTMQYDKPISGDFYAYVFLAISIQKFSKLSVRCAFGAAHARPCTM